MSLFALGVGGCPAESLAAGWAGNPNGGKACDFSIVIGYIGVMPKVARRLSPNEVAAARKRRLEAMVLQEIEGNPLNAEDIAMFEMFEREGWDHERRRAYILAQVRAPPAAK
jgi:hypothetical protein